MNLEPGDGWSGGRHLRQMRQPQTDACRDGASSRSRRRVATASSYLGLRLELALTIRSQ